MHGNELRKAGRVLAAVARLQRAIDLAPNNSAKASAGAFLARAAGETGNNSLFDASLDAYRRQLDQIDSVGMLTNRFTLREIQMRGLIGTGRPAEAARILAEPRDVENPIAPQWTVIERVTAAHVLLASGQRDGALEAMHAALTGAETYRLPHQAQRLARVAHAGRRDDIAHEAQALVLLLSKQLADREA
jgi:tetratricopeptide (TPR) repeat protein